MQCAALMNSNTREGGRHVQSVQRARLSEQVARVVFFICAILLVAVIIGVIVFIGSKAFLVFGQGVNIRGFFLGTFWDPTGNADPTGNGNPSYGAGGLILGSVITTVVAVIIVTPLAIGTAVFFTETDPRWLGRSMPPLLAIFSGVPFVRGGLLGVLRIGSLCQ